MAWIDPTTYGKQQNPPRSYHTVLALVRRGCFKKSVKVTTIKGRTVQVLILEGTPYPAKSYKRDAVK